MPILRGAPRAHARTGALRRRSTSSSRLRRADGGIPSAERLLVGLGRPRLPLAARRGRDRVDRLVVLLHRARQPPGVARRPVRRRPRSRRGGLGDPRRRLLPDREVPRLSRAAPGEALLVQMGGLHDLALRLRAPRRRLLRARVELPRRPLGRRPDDVGGDRDLGRRPAGRLDRLRRHVRAPCRQRPGARACRRRVRRARSLGVGPAARTPRRLHRGRGDDRDDHGRQRLLRDHPGALEARPREAGRRRARPALERPRQAAVGAQQLPDAAGRLRDALEPLPVHLRAYARVADPRRADGGRGLRSALLQPAPRRPERLVDPRERRDRARRACDRDPAVQRTASQRAQGPPPTLRAGAGDRCRLAAHPVTR